MTDEIRPVNIPAPHRVKPLSKDDRDENDERFSKKLTELVDLGSEERPSQERRKPDRRAEPPSPEPAPDAGHNLDVET